MNLIKYLFKRIRSHFSIFIQPQQNTKAKQQSVGVPATTLYKAFPHPPPQPPRQKQNKTPKKQTKPNKQKPKTKNNNKTTE